jgi:isocitrate dehydrogenase (NAD+)
MGYAITLIPGDGIGPEVSAAAVRVVDTCCPGIQWVPAYAGAAAAETHGSPLPESVIESVRRTRVALKGPCTTPVGHGFSSVNVALRKRLELYVSLRPVNSLEGVETHHEDVDLVVFRENTEGLYAGLEHEPAPGVVETLRVISATASRRFAEFAYEWCRYNGRRQVSLVHKASIMKLSDGLFLDEARAVAADYPFIATDEILTDHLCMELVLDPTQFDVLVMGNLVGDLMSDLCAGLVGGLGLVPGANIGDKYAVFEAVHGSAPDIAGKGVANPIALVRSAAMLLDYIGERRAAARIEAAVRAVLAAGEVRTGVFGGTATTEEITDAIIAALEAP